MLQNFWSILLGENIKLCSFSFRITFFKITRKDEESSGTLYVLSNLNNVNVALTRGDFDELQLERL